MRPDASNSPRQAPEVSVIIVNWRSTDYLRNCLASLYATSGSLDLEVIVIDSASFDGCDRMLEQHYPQVRFIQSHENLGFACANNLAFQSSHGRHVLFLNPDTEVIAGAVQLMLASIQQVPTPGVIGCRLLNSDGSIQTSCIQAFPTIINQLLDSEPLRHRFPRSRLWGTTALLEESFRPCTVEAISGACMMLRRDTFARLGEFSTDYFMYSEDIDLCRKACDAGLNNYYVSEAVVVHHGGGSSSKHPMGAFAARMTFQARWIYFRKFRSRSYAALYRCCVVPFAFGRIVAANLLMAAAQGERRVQLRSTARKWRAILAWAVQLSAATPRRA